MANRATGRVSRIFATSGGDRTNFRLAGLSAEETPGGDPNSQGYFYLLPSDPNYSALYSLLLVAATNRYNLHARVFGNIVPATDTSPGTNAHVNYLVVDWDSEVE